jgi:hypothetical protein
MSIWKEVNRELFKSIEFEGIKSEPGGKGTPLNIRPWDALSERAGCMAQ